jgi:signal peptidase I
MLGCLFEVLEALLFTLVIFFVIQMFVAQPYQVKQESMENTLMPDQYVLVDKLTPQFSEYHRGDVVVFNPPPGWTQDPGGSPFIKRVIGVGGDSVDIHGGHVFINGVQISEPYLFEGQPTQMSSESGKTWKLGPNQLFVMGDHRQASEDSRQFGPIDKSTVVGRAWIRYWPLNQFGFLPRATQSAAPSASPASSPSP